jgi:signal transduction histidine kinase/CheY-like chemotaxis protein
MAQKPNINLSDPAMTRNTSPFASDLRISANWIVAALTLLSLALLVVGQYQPEHAGWQIFTYLALALGVLTAAGWALCRILPRLGRPCLLLLVIGTIYACQRWAPVPGVLTLLVLPVAIAMPLIGLRVAFATALVSSLLVLLLAGQPAGGPGWPEAVVALLAIWGVAGLLALIHAAIRSLSGGLEAYYRRAEALAEEAQSQQGALKQAINDLEHANRQLALLNQHTSDLRMIAEEARQIKSKFVARVSHEFRTPLNMIIGLVSLMIDSPQIYDVGLSPKMREDLEVVQRNCELLAKMVNDVLDLTRVETDRLELHRDWTDLAQIIESAALAVRPLLDGKGLKLDLHLQAPLPRVYCDATRIEQVVLNLMSNAARYTERGGVTVEALRCEQRIQVSVADSGPGIAPHDVERIFEPFFQGSGERWRGRDGSGLGLSISKQFVDLHGGRLWLETQLGLGTTFTFQLPIAPLPEHAPEAAERLSEDWYWHERRSRASFAHEHYRPRLLVCDEGGGELGRALERYAADAEVEVVVTAGLAQAYQSLTDSPAQALIVNASGPGEVRAWVEAARIHAPGTPLLACTLPPSLERAHALGAAEHLVKPVTRADLERALARAARPPQRVLVVDDDANTIDLFRRMLEIGDDKRVILAAYSGEEALQVLRAGPVDVMLLDIVMPGMDGYAVLEAVQQGQQAGEIAEGLTTFLVSAEDPAERELTSPYLLVTFDRGLPPHRLLRCCLEVSALLVKPESALRPAPA